MTVGYTSSNIDCSRGVVSLEQNVCTLASNQDLCNQNTFSNDCHSVQQENVSKGSCPSGIVTSTISAGQWGNNIWRYAEVLATESQTNLKGYIPGTIIINFNLLVTSLTR